MSIVQTTARPDVHAPKSEPAARARLQNAMFDAATANIHNATALEWMLIKLLQLGARVSGRWGYRGFGACSRILQRLVPGRTFTFMLDKETAFAFPFADGYWSMLLGGSDIYEPEIETLLRLAAAEKYTLIDCGANYGYWSVLASGHNYGSQRVIAIEPSSQTFSILQNNAAINENRFACIQKAVGAARGRVSLSGRKHEARAVSIETGGDSEIVEMLTLDSLMDGGHIATSDKVVIKLDVEGQEIAALSGGSRLLQGDCIVICEDHGSDRNHTVSRYILDETPLKLFCFNPDTGRFMKIEDVTSLDWIKRFRNQGYNVFATSSAFWESKLRRNGGSRSAVAAPVASARLAHKSSGGVFAAVVKGSVMFSALMIVSHYLN